MRSRDDSWAPYILLGLFIIAVFCIGLFSAKSELNNSTPQRVKATVLDKQQVDKTHTSTRTSPYLHNSTSYISYYEVALKTENGDVCTMQVKGGIYAQLKVGQQIYVTAWYDNETGKCIKLSIN